MSVVATVSELICFLIKQDSYKLHNRYASRYDDKSVVRNNHYILIRKGVVLKPQFSLI